ncbi:MULTISPECIES: class F sortase [unclassified Kitasatospora]|uniref:class F sortase n=1 Tax=unclassified Kitasatospora TaxID=2633591 RepID=UPI0037FAE49F
MRAADTGPGSNGHPGAAPPHLARQGSGAGVPPESGRPGADDTAASGDRGARATGRRHARGSGHRRSRTAGPGPSALRRSAFGAAGLLCLVVGASVALSGQRTPVVRIEPSVHGGADTPAKATGPAANPVSGPAPASAAPATAPRPFAASVPTRLLIPAAGVDAPVTSLGLNADGTVEVPPADRAGETGWYRNGPTPGETGPAVLIGHYDTVHGPAVFHGLPKLRPGELIQVRRADGSTVDFRVRTLLQAAKDRFPTQTVYGDTPTPTLRLITCGGRIGSDGHWTDNIIVLADLAGPDGASG